MTFLIGILARFGLPERVRKPLATLIAIVGGALLLWGAIALWLHFHDKGVIERHDDKVNLEAEKGAREADSNAADQRLKDSETQRETKEAYDEAIKSAPSGAPGPASVRLACERLRRSGQDTAAIPACSGR